MHSKAIRMSEQARDKMNRLVVFRRRRAFLRMVKHRTVFPASANRFITRTATDSMTRRVVLRDERAFASLLEAGAVTLFISADITDKIYK